VELIPLIVVAVAGMLFLAQRAPYWRMRARIGRPAPDLRDLFRGRGDRGSVYYYFFSPGCWQCRAMRPAVDRLIARGERVVEVDVSRSCEVARRFGLRMIPALIAVREGRVTEVVAGRPSLPALRRLLGKDAVPVMADVQLAATGGAPACSPPKCPEARDGRPLRA
jgi:hypothetical protein